MKLKFIPIVLIALFVIAGASPIFAQTPKVGGSITVALVAEPRNLDPFSGAWHSGFIAAQIFNSLLELDQNLNPQPSLAESWQILEDEKAYLFKIREGVKWHDGQPFTVEDVKFSFEQIISKYDLFGALYFKNVKVEIVDDRTVKIIPEKFLPGVQTLLFASLDTVIVPKHILEGQDYTKSDFITHPVGTGPFKFKEWVKGSHIILERNSDYWKEGKPYLEKMIIRFITDPSTLLASLKAGEVDYVFRGLPYEAYDELSKDPNIEVIKSLRPPYKMFISFNMKDEILSNPLVRKAIAYALNREDIAKKVTLGICPKTDSWWSEAEISPSPNLKVYEYNPEKAEALLDQAGYPRGANGKRFTIEFLTRVGEAEEEEIADLVKDYLGKVGIEVVIKRVDFGTLLDLTANYNYQMVLWKSWVNPIWAYQQYHSSWIKPGQPFTNVFQYSNPEVDSLLDQWLSTSDPNKQKAILQRIDEIFSEDLPQIPLYNVVFLNVKSKELKGPDIPVGKYVFWDALENMYIYEEAAPQPTQPTQPTQPAEQPEQPPAWPMELVAGIIVVIVIVVVVALVFLRKK